MSVINQMLKDLEQRRSSSFNAKSGVLDNLGVGGSASGRNRTMNAVLFLLLVVVGLLAWLLWDRFIHKPVQIPVVAVKKSLSSTSVVERAITSPKDILAEVSIQEEEIKTPPSTLETMPENKTDTKKLVNEIKTELPNIVDNAAVVTVISSRIERIEPERLMATGKRITMSVYGEGFVRPLDVLLEWSDGRAFKVLNDSQFELISENELHLNFNPGTQADKWTVRIERQGGASSKRFAFNVYEPEIKEKEAVTKTPLKEEQETELTITRHDVDPIAKANNLFAKASGLLKSRQSSEAVKVLKESLSINPQHHRARELLASLLFQNAQYIPAADLLEMGIKQQPEQISFSLLLARVRMEQGRDTDAITVLESQKPLARDYSDYYALLAALYQRSARHVDAARIYQGLVKVFPNRAVWWMGLGISMQASEQSAEALSAYQRALVSKGLSVELKKFVQQRVRLLSH